MTRSRLATILTVLSIAHGVNAKKPRDDMTRKWVEVNVPKLEAFLKKTVPGFDPAVFLGVHALSDPQHGNWASGAHAPGFSSPPRAREPSPRLDEPRKFRRVIARRNSFLCRGSRIDQFLVMVSSRFKSIRATLTHAASCAGLSPAPGVVGSLSPTASNFSALPGSTEKTAS